MARMYLSFGACPTCGEHVPRTLSQGTGIQQEIFHCPDHGRLVYGLHSVPIGALNRAAERVTTLVSQCFQPRQQIEWIS